MKKGVIIFIVVVLGLFMIMVMVGGFIFMQLTKETHVPVRSFLKIQLAGDISDADTSAFSKTDSIQAFWYQIKRARIDNRIHGIILKISYAGAGFAKIEELGRFLKDFRQSGKKVYAYLEGGSLREYYLATFADKIFVLKGSDLYLNGLASEASFFKNTLSKLGVQADMFHIGEYKTASNIFTEDKMTPAHRESITRLLDDIFNYTIEQIAVNRGLRPEAVRAAINAFPFDNSAYLEAKLIDKEIYEDQLFDQSFEDYNTIDYDVYKEGRTPRPFVGSKKIGIIFAGGEIHMGGSGGPSLFSSEVMGSDTVSSQLRLLRKDPDVKAVVLRVDSPGGSAVASEIIRREAELLAKEKPLVISMSDLAASGGYWISMSSKKHVFALPQTITGSIGVIFGKFVLKGLYDKIGIDKEVVKTTEFADIFSDYRPFNELERSNIETLMKKIYNDFLEKVANARDMKISEVDAVGRGRVWTGVAGKELNLVDKLGGLNEAVEEAKRLANIPASESVGLRIYPKKKSIMDYFGDLLGVGVAVKDINPVTSLETKLKMYDRFFPALMSPYKVEIK